MTAHWRPIAASPETAQTPTGSCRCAERSRSVGPVYGGGGQRAVAGRFERETGAGFDLRRKSRVGNRGRGNLIRPSTGKGDAGGCRSGLGKLKSRVRGDSGRRGRAEGLERDGAPIGGARRVEESDSATVKLGSAVPVEDLRLPGARGVEKSGRGCNGIRGRGAASAWETRRDESGAGLRGRRRDGRRYVRHPAVEDLDQSRGGAQYESAVLRARSAGTVGVFNCAGAREQDGGARLRGIRGACGHGRTAARVVAISALEASHVFGGCRTTALAHTIRT